MSCIMLSGIQLFMQKKKKNIECFEFFFFCYTVSRKNQIYLKRIEKDYELYFRHMLRA
jgi:hypothetical protein